MGESKNKIISLAAVLAAIAALGLGFTTFSSVLLISSKTEVTPTSKFSVEFSKSFSRVSTGSLVGVGTAPRGVEDPSGTATLNNLSITDLEVNFTEPGQKVTYSFYIFNTGDYAAYLNSIVTTAAQGSTKFKNCVADFGGGATQELVDAACNGISIKFGASLITKNITSVGTDELTFYGVSVGKGSVINASIEILYASDAARVDGPITVDLGDISINFSTKQ